MFTGIIQEIGTIESIEENQGIKKFSIKAPQTAQDLKPGDSVCVDGACLTVVHNDKQSFSVEAIPETLERTICGQYEKGSKVNLEPSMQISDRFHGHIVTGHIDFVGKIKNLETKDKTIALTVEFPLKYGKFFAIKGSVTVNGVSLTITKLNTESFEIHIIPHTQNATTLDSAKSTESGLNIEIDLIARYLESLVNSKEDESNYFFLKERGFI